MDPTIGSSSKKKSSVLVCFYSRAANSRKLSVHYVHGFLLVHIHHQGGRTFLVFQAVFKKEIDHFIQRRARKRWAKETAYLQFKNPCALLFR